MHTQPTTNPSASLNLDAEILRLHSATAEPQRLFKSRVPLPGDVWLARVAFSDQSGSKVRPSAVLGVFGSNVVVAPLSTQPPKNEFDVEVLTPCSGGLRQSRTARCSMIVPIARCLIFRLVGRLSAEDLDRVVSCAGHWYRSVIAAGSTAGNSLE